MRLRLIVITVITLFALPALAGVSEYSIRQNRIDLDNSPGYNELKVLYPTSPFYVAPDETRNYGKVSLVYNREQHSDLTWDYPWRFNVEVVVYENGSWQTGSPITLSISSETDNYIFLDYAVFETNDLTFERKIQITDYSAEYYTSGSWVAAANPTTDIHIPSDIHLELSIITERFYELDNDETHFIRFYENTHELKWPFIQGAEEYDIEWVFIDALSKEYVQITNALDYASAQALNPGVSFNDNYDGSLPFELKEPTRINVKGNRYVLDMTYPEGVLFFRMRPVGRYVGTTENPNGEYESVKPGAWTYTKTKHPSNQISSINLLSMYTITNAEAFAETLNWAYGINYAEDGKSVSTLSYFDGAGRGRQNSVYNTSDNITLVGEALFDYEGRQTVSVIPAPVQGRNFAYQENFNEYSNGVNFDAQHFDKTSPDPLYSSTSTDNKGSAQYFSTNNTLTNDPFRDYIPTANGYVYSQVRYNKDGTGRVSEVSSPGQTFSMNDDHTVKYYYSNPTEVELRRLFGKEVGNIENYKKVTIVDPNGQASVQYVDNHGRIIATGLTGDAPENLIEIDNPGVITVTSALPVHNHFFSSTESSSTVTIDNLSTSAQYSFSYDMDGVLYGVEYPAASSTILCVACVYKLAFYIENPDGSILYSSSIIISQDGSETCATTEGAVNYNPTNGVISTGNIVFTQIGEYKVHKILSVYTDETQANIDAMIVSIIGTEQDYVDAAIVNVNVAGCYTNCDDYCDYIAGYNYDNQIPAPTTPWSSLTLAQKQATAFWDDCINNHCNINEALFGDLEDQEDITNGEEIVFGTISGCDGIKSQMVDQISPGGVFFTDVSNSLSNFWSLVNTNLGSITLYTDYNPDGSPATGATVISSLSYLQDEANFQIEWLPILLQFHREYCHYDICLELNDISYNGINSMEFDILMSQPQTWNSTTTAPYLTTAGSAPIHPDPFVGSYMDDQGATSDLVVLLNNLEEPCSTGTVNAYDYVNDLSANCSLTITGNEWSTFVAVYQNQKQIQIDSYKASVTANYYDGCSYYDDEYNIVVENTGDIDGDNDIDVDDFIALETMNGSNGISFNCLDQCDINVANWISNFSPSCYDYIVTNSYLNDIEDLFYAYCLSSCFTGNTGGWLYDNGSAEYDAIESYFNTNSIAISCFQNLVVTAGTFTVTTTTQVNVINPCLELIIEDFNQTWNAPTTAPTLPSMTLSLPTTFPADFPNPSSYTACDDLPTSYTQNSGDAHKLSTSTMICSPAEYHVFDLFEMDGTPIDLNTVSQILNLQASQIDVTLAYATVVPVSGPSYQAQLNLSRCFYSNVTTVINYEPPTSSWTADCINEAIVEAIIDAQNEYDDLYTATFNSISEKVNCIENVVEIYKMTYELKEYQYTLYYYDQAGNLVSTVPPAGVDILGATAFDTDGHWDGTTNPAHTQQTLYTFNGANLLIEQNTPDGGITNYYYDDLYRLRFSQNEQQATDNKLSYTKYDELGRIIEAGEAGDPGLTTLNFLPELNNYSWPGNGLRRDYMQTFYETGYSGYESAGITSTFSNGQQNLRNRVGAVFQFTGGGYIASGGGTSLVTSAHGYVKTITSYSYDEHGNVNELVQTNSTLNYYGHAHKHMRYEYDLLSGNVKQVIYQEGELDEWRHKYHYDATNRLVRAWTSDDGEEWEMDAKYFYYLHGPLARVETGHDKVQGTDYAYNFQGWLKGVNSTYLNAANDMGNDGHTTGLDKYSGQDTYGYMLGYFTNDYSNIGSTNNFASTAHLISENGNYGNLYNGNITHMVTAMKDNNEAFINITGSIYTHDQLQRIKSQDVYQVGSAQYSNYLSNGFTSTTAPASNAYATSYIFDPNGNLKFLKRYDDAGVLMDDFTYNYDVTKINQLLSVTDAATASSVTTDIESQPTNNYTYNDIGQLTMDAQENLTIEWAVTGKVRRIYKNGNPIDFIYDAMGNRVMKVEGGIDNINANYTYYVYDASGNVMATYDRTIMPIHGLPEDEDWSDKLVLTDRTIYGSKRVGTKNENKLLAEYDFTPTTILTGGYYETYASLTGVTHHPENFDKTNRKVGDKFYEFSEHRGNVLEVTTDRKIPNTGETAFEADIISYTDYFPYGMVLPGRSGSSNSYKYGFQGQEKDDEIKGENNSLNYKYRMHDPRIGRFFAVDPLANKYPFYSPFAFSGNRVLDMIELEGLEPDAPDFFDLEIDEDGRVNANYQKTLIQKANAGQVLERAEWEYITIKPPATFICDAACEHDPTDLFFSITSSHPDNPYKYSMTLFYVIPAEDIRPTWDITRLPVRPIQPINNPIFTPGPPALPNRFQTGNIPATFPVNQANITNLGAINGQLANIANALNQNPNATFTITGMTNLPLTAINPATGLNFAQLANARAFAIQNQLVNNFGVNPAQIQIAPPVGNATPGINGVLFVPPTPAAVQQALMTIAPVLVQVMMANNGAN